MAMGTRDGEQSPLWVVTADLPTSPGHPFYTRLNAVLDAHNFDRFVEKKCQPFYAAVELFPLRQLQTETPDKRTPTLCESPLNH